LIGSARTLSSAGEGSGYEVLRGLVELCKEKMWIFDLVPDSVEGHSWMNLKGTQTTQCSGRDSFEATKAFQTDSNRVTHAHKEVNSKLPAAGMKRPGRVCKVSEELLNKRPVLRDIMNEIG